MVFLEGFAFPLEIRFITSRNMGRRVTHIWIISLAFFFGAGKALGDPPLWVVMELTTGPGRPIHQKVFLREVEDTDPRARMIEISIPSSAASTRPFETLVVPLSSFPQGARRTLRKLLETRPDWEPLWSVEIDGKKHNAILYNWRLVMARRGRDPIVVSALRPQLFLLDGTKGEIEIFRDLSAAELTSHAVTLKAEEYRSVQSRPADTLPRVDPFDENVASSLEADGGTQIWNDAVVLIRQKPDGTNTLESVSGTLWKDVSSAYYMRLDGRMEKLPIERGYLDRTLRTMERYRSLRPFRIEDREYDGFQHGRIETLIIDLRDPTHNPTFYFLLSKDAARLREGNLQLISVDRISPVTEDAIPYRRMTAAARNTGEIRPRTQIAQKLADEFVRWRNASAPARASSGPLTDLITFLVSSPLLAGQDSQGMPDYPELLVAVERLNQQGLSIPLPPFRREEFEQLRALATAAAANPSASLFVIRPQLTTNLRFRGGASLASRIEVVDLNEKPGSVGALLEIIAQSRTGRRLLHYVLPAVGPLFEFRFVPRAQRPEVVLEQSDHAGSTLKINSKYSLGELVAPLVRVLVLGVREGIIGGPSNPLFTQILGLPGTSRLDAIRESYQITAAVMEELLQFNPALYPFVAGALRTPTDQELIIEWDLRFDAIAQDQMRRRSYLGQCAFDLLIHAPGAPVPTE